MDFKKLYFKTLGFEKHDSKKLNFKKLNYKKVKYKKLFLCSPTISDGCCSVCVEAYATCISSNYGFDFK